MGSVDLHSLLKSFGLWPYVRSFLSVCVYQVHLTEWNYVMDSMTYFSVKNFYILKQNYCALVGVIKDSSFISNITSS